MWSCHVSTFLRPVVHINPKRFVVRLLGTGSSSSSSSGSETLTTLEVGSHQSELVVKKSQFLGYAQHVENWKEAQDYLDVVRAEHPKARHVCFGFVAGVNPVQERCSDDGEPTGTAGVPILGAIKGEGLSDTMCIVVRYFGGIKLGAEAYSSVRSWSQTSSTGSSEEDSDTQVQHSCLSALHFHRVCL